MLKRQRSLAFLLTAQSIVLTSVLLLAFWAMLYLTMQRTLARQDHEVLRDRLRTIGSLLESEEKEPARLKRRVEEEWVSREFDRVYVRIMNEKGEVLTQSPGLKDFPVFEQTRLSSETIDRLQEFESSGEVFIGTHMAVAVARPGGHDQRYFIEMVLDRTSEESLLRAMREALIGLGTIGLLLSVVSARLFANRALKPVHEISQLASRVTSTSNFERIDPEALPLEFHDLASTLNQMLERLQDGYERLSRFSADMAHELRTPVNTLLNGFGVTLSRERAPGEYAAALSSGIEECERLKRIIDSLLFIARSKSPSHELHKQPLDLSEALHEIVGFYSASAQEAGVELILNVKSDLRVNAELTLLQRAVGNLISNSIRHAKGASQVVVRAESVGSRARIEISDDGSGLAPEHLAKVGERFFRADSSRSMNSGGTGLGLSIVKVIVEIHGGCLKMTSRIGEGTTAVIDFELAHATLSPSQNDARI